MPSRKALFNAAHSLKRITLQQGPQAAMQALDSRGGQLSPQERAHAEGIINKYSSVPKNNGGPIMAYNMGGPISEEEKKRREMMARSRIAKSRVPATPLQARPQMPQQPGQQKNPLQEIGMELGKKALMSSLGPVGALFGNLFNKGGKVPHNPYGYNEGGAVQETPLKKVMDEQKLDQQAMAFELEQKRKQETHEQSMRIKEQQAKQAAAMKKAAATTNKTATKPKGPLSK